MSPRFDSPPPPGDSAGQHPDVDDDFLFTKPRPRPARSSAETREIRTRNRRREYLERNPGYFKSTEHELADPILYDSLIRRFQTPAEREAESKEKGYARVLEGSLLRGEEKLARLAAATTTTETGGSPGTGGGEEGASTATGIEGETAMEWQGEATMTTTTTTTVTQAPVQTKMTTLDEPTSASTTTSTMFATFTAPAQQPLPRFGGLSFGEPSPSSSSSATSQTTTRRTPAPLTASATEATNNLAAALALTGTDIPAQTREQGREQWHSFLRERFVRGGDEDFDYAGLVDNNDELDTLERREKEDAWFDEEEPDWASDGAGDGDGEEGRRVERVLEGETGVQDF